MMAMPRRVLISDSTSAHGRVLEVLIAGNVVAKEIIIQYFPNAPDKKVEVTITTDFDVLSGGILDPFMGTFELKGKTVMRLE